LGTHGWEKIPVHIPTLARVRYKSNLRVKNHTRTRTHRVPGTRYLYPNYHPYCCHCAPLLNARHRGALFPVSPCLSFGSKSMHHLSGHLPDPQPASSRRRLARWLALLPPAVPKRTSPASTASCQAGPMLGWPNAAHEPQCL
jgi:hypothetical protein